MGQGRKDTARVQKANEMAQKKRALPRGRVGGVQNGGRALNIPNR